MNASSFELLSARFTLLQLQRTVEALAGVTLHKQNFRRLVEGAGLVEGTGKLEARTPAGIPVYNVALPVLEERGERFHVWTAPAPERRHVSERMRVG